MIYWILHLLTRIRWFDRIRLLALRQIKGIAGLPIASVLANSPTKPIARLVMSPDMGSSTGIWSLKTLIRYGHLSYGWG